MFKYACLAVVSAFTFYASAQGTFESSGLGDIDPWGVGTLSRAEGALPNTLWQNSDEKTLSTLFSRTSPRALSPVARELVARTMLSSARRPEGERSDELLLKRLKIIEDLGNPDIYADFIRQTTGVEGVNSPFEVGIDRRFAVGNLASACSTVRATRQTSAYLMNARAVCMALEGDLDSAELALEFARGEGQQDIWFVTVIGAMGVENAKSKPAPKYDSGLKIALSLGADLPIPANGFSGIHPALAAQLVTRTDIPRSLRIQLADVTAFAGVMSEEDYRKAYRTEPVRVRAVVPTLDGTNIIIPEDEDEPNPNTPVNPLDEALQAADNAEKTQEERAALYQRALMLARTNLDRYRMTARVLLPEIRRIRSRYVLAQYGELFALTAMIADDSRLASRIINQSVVEGGPPADEFLLAWLDGIQILAGQDRSPQSSLSVSSRLAEYADSATQDRALRMIHMIMSLGGPVAPNARALMSNASDETLRFGREISKRDILLTKAALGSDALGEGALRTALLIGRDASMLKMFDLADLVDALAQSGQEDLARELALEGIRYYRPRG